MLTQATNSTFTNLISQENTTILWGGYLVLICMIWFLKMHDGPPIKLNISGLYIKCNIQMWLYIWISNVIWLICQLMLKWFFLTPKKIWHDNCWCCCSSRGCYLWMMFCALKCFVNGECELVQGKCNPGRFIPR